MELPHLLLGQRQVSEGLSDLGALTALCGIGECPLSVIDEREDLGEWGEVERG